MSKFDLEDSYSPISYYAKKMHLTTFDLARALNCTPPTIREYIKNPYSMRLKDVMKLSGLFGVPPMHLIYLLQRNKPKIVKNRDEWFLRDLKDMENKYFDDKI